MPQIREQIAMVHLPPSKTLKYLFHVRKTRKDHTRKRVVFSFFISIPVRGVRRLTILPDESGKSTIC